MIKLVMPQTQIYVGETGEDFIELTTIHPTRHAPHATLHATLNVTLNVIRAREKTPRHCR